MDTTASLVGGQASDEKNAERAKQRHRLHLHCQMKAPEYVACAML